jgi:hypothetical protein
VWQLLKTALDSAQATANGGFDLNMWGTIVNADGIVVAIAYTGSGYNDQWADSRVISAQKASTAWGLSLPTLALSTANLYSATQPGGSLYGLATSNPVNTDAAYGGESSQYGTTSDYMVGKKIGGINTFGAASRCMTRRGPLSAAWAYPATPPVRITTSRGRCAPTYTWITCRAGSTRS